MVRGSLVNWRGQVPYDLCFVAGVGKGGSAAPYARFLVSGSAIFGPTKKGG